MYSNTWINCHVSICSISFKDHTDKKIASGSGFKVGNYLVTNNHVFTAPPTTSTVELKFVSEDGHTISARKVVSLKNFQARLQIGDHQDSWDYAILLLNDTEFKDVPSIELSDSRQIKIGQDIAILGFQFEQENLSIKRGILSSRFIQAGVKYMQLDASVNQGNSGGPLIDPLTNKVVGIVTRKHTGLTKAFDSLLNSTDANIKALSAAQGGISVSGIDLVVTSRVVQEQMKIAAQELRRSANVGIGYAYELDHIIDYFAHL